MPTGFYLRTEENTRKIREYANSEEGRRKNKERAIKQFSDPKARELASKNAIERFKDPKQRETLRIKAIERNKDPQRRKKHSEQIKKYWSEHPEKLLMGEKNPSYKGGRCKKGGYFFILSSEHPFCDCKGYVAEHRLVAEKELGRYLTSEETIHHINEIKDDNRPENLYLFSTKGKHVSFHFNKIPLTSNLLSVAIDKIF